MFPSLDNIGRWLIIIGIAVTLIGTLLLLISRFTGWEKLPGTIKFQSGSLTCIVPILGSILISILLTVLLNLAARFFNK